MLNYFYRQLQRRFFIHPLTNELDNAITRNDLEEVTAILSAQPALVNSQGDYTESPLYLATAYGSLEMVHLLLEKGADPHYPVPLYSGGTALHLAAEIGDVDKMKALINYGANINAKTADSSFRSLTPGHQIINRPRQYTHGYVYADKLRKLADEIDAMEMPTLAEMRDTQDYTPLHLAALRGQVEGVKFLLRQRGIQAFAIDSCDKTPLDLASEQLEFDLGRDNFPNIVVLFHEHRVREQRRPTLWQQLLASNYFWMGLTAISNYLNTQDTSESRHLCVNAYNSIAGAERLSCGGYQFTNRNSTYFYQKN